MLTFENVEDSDAGSTTEELPENIMQISNHNIISAVNSNDHLVRLLKYDKLESDMTYAVKRTTGLNKTVVELIMQFTCPKKELSEELASEGDVTVAQAEDIFDESQAVVHNLVRENELLEGDLTLLRDNVDELRNLAATHVQTIRDKENTIEHLSREKAATFDSYRKCLTENGRLLAIIDQLKGAVAGSPKRKRTKQFPPTTPWKKKRPSN